MARSPLYGFFVRARFSIAWRLRAICNWTYARLVVAPKLMRAGELRAPIEVRIVPGAAIVFDADRVRKIAVGAGAALRRESENFRRAIEQWPVLSSLLAPVALDRCGVAHCLQMDRLREISSQEAQEKATHLFRIMRGCKYSAQESASVVNLPEVNAGVAALAALFGSAAAQTLQSKLLRAAERGVFDFGFAHGDFHAGNIMLDDGGNPRLIDLDCVRLQGVQQLDALYFVLEAERVRSGKHWYQQIAAFLRDEAPGAARLALDAFDVKPTPDLSLVYLLDRVGQEFVYQGFQYHVRNLAPAMIEIERSDA